MSGAGNVNTSRQVVHDNLKRERSLENYEKLGLLAGYRRISTSLLEGANDQVVSSGRAKSFMKFKKRKVDWTQVASASACPAGGRCQSPAVKGSSATAEQPGAEVQSPTPAQQIIKIVTMNYSTDG